MRRHLPAILGLAALLALVTMPFTSFPALAAAPRDQGWWTVTNPGGLPAQPPAPPDVAAGDLLIQGGPNAPTAFAALIYELDPGVTASTLTLAVAPNSVTTPSGGIQLCQLITPIAHPDQGGPLSDAPAYNCSKNVIATPDSSGKAYKFDVSAMTADRLVAVALLPSLPVDRIVLSPPDNNSLATQGGGDAGTAAPADVGVGTGASEASGALPSDSVASSPFVASPTGGDFSTPAVGAGPASGPGAAAAPTGSSNAGGTFVPAVSSTPSKATPLLVLLFVVAGLGGTGLWLYAGRQRDDVGVSGPTPA
jgi:F0F1-type ATP synthase membrane subunit c/vacuolar-type H+-ATPase subunit K